MNNSLAKMELVGLKSFEKEGRTIVSMDDGAVVEVGPGQKSKELFTFGLSGCTATAVLAEYENGIRKGCLTHYSPVDVIQNKNFLVDNLSDEGLSGNVQAKVFIRGKWVPDGEKFKMVPAGDTAEELSLIESVLELKFGSRVDIEILPYSTKIMQVYDKKSTQDPRNKISFFIHPQNEAGVPAEIHWQNGVTSFK